MLRFEKFECFLTKAHKAEVGKKCPHALQRVV